ncbi:SAM-dependent methyltransferase [Ramlibacter tataouinensis]|uniref:SAM-dependent methyltransferase n=1 Tax=Ramlibacter tataouinensis TaxID=94132 RepID=UPI0009EE79F0|nr:class I SAM-dependent methyltransferase [Ramlibacter tataouinensis]
MTATLLKSCLATEETLMLPSLQGWAQRLKEAPGHLHRKVWEWCFISQALAERGMLEPGRKGLGFAVGQEPLTAAFASCGADILATDLFSEQAQARGWIETAQHAEGFAAINKRGLCDDGALRQRVRFQFADMNAIDPEFEGRFDFVWSACAFEHLGSLEHGARFVLNSMRCLKPGGIAVHTTEYNVSSNGPTVETGATVLYRRRDIEDIVRRLRREGHQIEVDFRPGRTAADRFIDLPPYKHDVHLKIQIASFVSTSIGLIVRKSAGRTGLDWLKWTAGRLFPIS